MALPLVAIGAGAAALALLFGKKSAPAPAGQARKVLPDPGVSSPGPGVPLRNKGDVTVGFHSLPDGTPVPAAIAELIKTQGVPAALPNGFKVPAALTDLIRSAQANPLPPGLTGPPGPALKSMEQVMGVVAGAFGVGAPVNALIDLQNAAVAAAPKNQDPTLMALAAVNKLKTAIAASQPHPSTNKKANTP